MLKRSWSRSKADSGRGRWAALYVTMNPQGHIFITKCTCERLGEPTAVELLNDKANASIGMAPSSAETENPYPALKRSGPRMCGTDVMVILRDNTVRQAAEKKHPSVMSFPHCLLAALRESVPPRRKENRLDPKGVELRTQRTRLEIGIGQAIR